MKFKFKKRVLKLGTSTFERLYYIFWVSMSLMGIFTFKKLWAEKDEKFSIHLRDLWRTQKKFMKIFDYLSLKLSLQNHFLRMFLWFFAPELFAS